MAPIYISKIRLLLVGTYLLKNMRIFSYSHANIPSLTYSVLKYIDMGKQARKLKVKYIGSFQQLGSADGEREIFSISGGKHETFVSRLSSHVNRG